MFLIRHNSTHFYCEYNLHDLQKWLFDVIRCKRYVYVCQFRRNLRFGLGNKKSVNNPKKKKTEGKQISSINLESPENDSPLQLITLDSSHLMRASQPNQVCTAQPTLYQFLFSLPRPVYLLCVFQFLILMVFIFLQEGPIA